MADIDLERLALLKARYGKPTNRNLAGVRSIGARFKASSRGLAAARDKARSRRTLEAANGRTARDAFAGALRRVPRS
jgi:hypothetical protein